MHLIIILAIIVPILGFGINLFFKNHQEKQIAFVSNLTSFTLIILSFVSGALWLSSDQKDYSIHLFSIYKSHNFDFALTFYYDKLTMVYSIVATLLLFIISVFSKTYMHRESGYKRFYIHFQAFGVGLMILIFSGNFEMFILGWEIIGISSFLLISFYRDRFLPVKNAMKVLSFYRISDTALLAGIWFCHHLFHKNISFVDLITVDYSLPNSHYIEGLTIGILFVFAASIKCAQFPFSSWLPRALEGPTVSSAIFYGSLSLHIGVFLLLRTFPIWENIDIVKISIGVIGVITTIVSYYISMVQSTTKTQLAYASITQVGLIFIEIALGWHTIALVHFALHAFYRTYQFLVSPSSLSYLIHDQFLHYDANKKSAFSLLPTKLKYSLYTFSIMEAYIDRFWFYQIWRRFKKFALVFNVFRKSIWQWIFSLVFILSIIFQHIYPIEFFTSHEYVPYFFSFIALILIFLAWTERKSALNSWINIVLSQLFFMDGIVHQGTVNLIQIIIYLTGVILAALIGAWALKRVISLENNIDLNSFHGHIYEHKKLGMTFLLSSLILIGFPISPTFVGLDLLFSEIEKENTTTLFLSALVFIFLELATIRIYARVFLGLHVKPYHEVAFKSS